MATPVDPTPQQADSVVYNRTRVLLGWLGDDEGATALVGNQPSPGEIPQLVERVRAARMAVQTRPPFEPRSALVDDPGFAELLTETAGRPAIAAHFAAHTWRPAVVDLREVLSFQKYVSLAGADERVASATAGRTEVLGVCIPSEQEKPKLAVARDLDKRGFTVTSLNPNLRFAHDAEMIDVPVTPGPEHEPTVMKAFLFIPSIPASYLQVARYRGRFFVRDGYHRAAAMLHVGVHTVPCIFIEARSWEEVCPTVGVLALEEEQLRDDHVGDVVAPDRMKRRRYREVSAPPEEHQG